MLIGYIRIFLFCNFFIFKMYGIDFRSFRSDVNFSFIGLI